jgi:hypothetical protein
LTIKFVVDIVFYISRQSRIDTEGAMHHIIVRGIERRKIFNDVQDRYDFIDNLGLILTQPKHNTICPLKIPTTAWCMEKQQLAIRNINEMRHQLWGISG